MGKIANVGIRVRLGFGPRAETGARPDAGRDAVAELERVVAGEDSLLTLATTASRRHDADGLVLHRAQSGPTVRSWVQVRGRLLDLRALDSRLFEACELVGRFSLAPGERRTIIPVVA